MCLLIMSFTCVRRVGGHGAESVFTLRLRERRFYTVGHVCKQHAVGTCGFCGSFSMMTMCVRPHHNDAFILPESHSSVFSGIFLDSRLERRYFLNWQ